MIIDDDACRCAVFDEQGRLIPAVELTCALAQIVLLEYPKSSIVIEDDALEELQPEIEAFGGHCRPGGATLAQVSTAIKQFDAVLGGGSSGRFWFRESAPTCDAILTLAHLLQAISRSDAPLSEVVAASISK
jgi:phosphomannomutase